MTERLQSKNYINYFNCQYWEENLCTYLEKDSMGSFADWFILRPLNIPPNLAIGDGEEKVCIAPFRLGLKCNRRVKRRQS